MARSRPVHQLGQPVADLPDQGQGRQRHLGQHLGDDPVAEGRCWPAWAAQQVKGAVPFSILVNGKEAAKGDVNEENSDVMQTFDLQGRHADRAPTRSRSAWTARRP